VSITEPRTFNPVMAADQATRDVLSVLSADLVRFRKLVDGVLTPLETPTRIDPRRIVRLPEVTSGESRPEPLTVCGFFLSAKELARE